MSELLNTPRLVDLAAVYRYFAKIVSVIPAVADLLKHLWVRLSSTLGPAVYPTGVGSDLMMILHSLKDQPPQIHDIKIQIAAKIHQKLSELGYEENKKNKVIMLKNIPTPDEKLHLIALVYPETIQLDVACSNNPIVYDADSLFHLLGILCDFQTYIYNLTEIKLPDPREWLITHHHFNKDGSVAIEGERFNITVKDEAGIFIRFYLKKMPDGTKIPRIEMIRTNAGNLFDEMQRVLGVGSKDGISEKSIIDALSR